MIATVIVRYGRVIYARMMIAISVRYTITKLARTWWYDSNEVQGHASIKLQQSSHVTFTLALKDPLVIDGILA